MTQAQQRQLDEAIAARVYDSLLFGRFNVGDSIEVDISFGHEGPDGWTRLESTVEQRHVDLAESWAKS
jgi:hypothetical protein